MQLGLGLPPASSTAIASKELDCRQQGSKPYIRVRCEATATQWSGQTGRFAAPGHEMGVYRLSFPLQTAGGWQAKQDAGQTERFAASGHKMGV